MSQKGLAPILIVLLIAAVVGGYFVYQNQTEPTTPPRLTVPPTPSPASQAESTGSAETAKWRVQKGEYYEFKYPDSWRPKSSEFSGVLTFGPSNNQNVWLIIDENTNTNSRETPNSLADQALGSQEKAITRKSITINQHPAIIQERQNKIGVRIETYIGEVQSITNFLPEDGGPKLTKGTMSIFMEVRENDNTILNENRKLFNQILSTFKFIK